MNLKKGNILQEPSIKNGEKEIFEEIISSPDFTIERIFTNKHYDKPGDWYDQEKDEWVLILQGEAILEFENKEIVSLSKSDYIFIPARKKHRINESSKSPKCIWLAIHGNLK